MTRLLSIVAVLVSTGTVTGVAAQSAAPCTQFNVAGSWILTQSNGPVVHLELQQAAGGLSGTATYSYKGQGGGLLYTNFGGRVDGTVEGTISGTSLKFVIRWDRGRIGQYAAGVQADDGTLRGRTSDPADRSSQATFTGKGAAVCASVRPAAADSSVTQVPHIDAQTKPVKSFGRASWTATAKDDVDIYTGPGGEFTVVGVLDAGVSAPIVGQKDDWYQLKLAGIPGGSGWVAGDHLKTVLIRPARPK